MKFTASGGSNYRWSISDKSIGRIEVINKSNNSEARYYAVTDSGTQRITVSGTVNGAETSAYAIIVHSDKYGESNEINIGGN